MAPVFPDRAAQLCMGMVHSRSRRDGPRIWSKDKPFAGGNFEFETDIFFGGQGVCSWETLNQPQKNVSVFLHLRHLSSDQLLVPPPGPLASH